MKRRVPRVSSAPIAIKSATVKTTVPAIRKAASVTVRGDGEGTIVRYPVLLAITALDVNKNV